MVVRVLRIFVLLFCVLTVSISMMDSFKSAHCFSSAFVSKKQRESGSFVQEVEVEKKRRVEDDERTKKKIQFPVSFEETHARRNSCAGTVQH